VDGPHCRENNLRPRLRHPVEIVLLLSQPIAGNLFAGFQILESAQTDVSNSRKIFGNGRDLPQEESYGQQRAKMLTVPAPLGESAPQFLDPLLALAWIGTQTSDYLFQVSHRFAFRARSIGETVERNQAGVVPRLLALVDS
jgi:hypothetical protein